MKLSAMRLLAIVVSLVTGLICALPIFSASAETVITPSSPQYNSISDAKALKERVLDRVFHIQEMATNKLSDVHFSEYDVEWREADTATRIYLLAYQQSAKTAKKSWALLLLKEKASESRRHLLFATINQGSFAGDYFLDVETKQAFRILGEEMAAPKSMGN